MTAKSAHKENSFSWSLNRVPSSCSSCAMECTLWRPPKSWTSIVRFTPRACVSALGGCSLLLCQVRIELRRPARSELRPGLFYPPVHFAFLLLECLKFFRRQQVGVR